MDLKKVFLFLLFINALCIVFAQNYMVVQDSVAARLINLVEPEYPPAFAKNKVTGSVILQVKVFPDSSIYIEKILESYVDLESFAIDAVKKSTFIPAFVKGEPVESSIFVEVSFPPKSYKEKQRTFTFEPVKLKQDIMQWIEDDKTTKEKEYFDHFYYPLSSHLRGNSFDNTYFLNDIFVEQLPYLKDNMAYQNYYRLYQIDQSDFYTQMTTKKYPYIPLLVKTDLNLGEYEIRYANIELYKHHALNIEHLNLSAQFLGHSGQIPLFNEESNNSRITLAWEKDNFALKANYKNMDQDYSSKHLNSGYFNRTSEEYVKEKQHDLQLSTQYHFLKAGFRLNNNKINNLFDKSIFLKQKQYVVGLQDTLFHNIFNLSYQYSKNDYKENLDTLIYLKKDKQNIFFNHTLMIHPLTIHHQLFYDLDENMHQYSMLTILNLSDHFDISLDYQTQNKLNDHPYQDQFVQSFVKNEYAISFDYHNQRLKSLLRPYYKEKHQKIHASNLINQNEKYPGIEIQNEIKWQFTYLNLIIKQKTEYQNSKDLYYLSQINNKTTLIIEKELKHDNKISVGIDTYYSDEVLSEKGLWGYSFVTDTFVKIDITKLFDFKVSLKNMNSNTFYLTEDLTPYLFSAQINWYFIN